jgi:hypothetical protein
MSTPHQLQIIDIDTSSVLAVLGHNSNAATVSGHAT